MRSSLPQLPPPRRRPRRKPSEKRKKTMSMRKLGAKLIGAVIFTYALMLVIRSIFNNSPRSLSKRFTRGRSSEGMDNSSWKEQPTNGKRIALFVPFIGDTFPPYMDVFCQSAGGSASIMDVYIFHNGVPYTGIQTLPHNVKLIDMESTEKLARLLLRVLQKDHGPEEGISLTKFSENQFIQVITKWLANNPYALVEFKIASGHIFKDYLTDYSHWGYTDLDILWGDLQSWITTDEWNDYDIVTYTFGDQDRAYLRGQFTFHKNEERINQLWRGCSHLDGLEERFYNLLKRKNPFHFESAEGCYSKVVLDQKDVTIKFAVKAWTDHIEPPYTPSKDKNTFYSHGVYTFQDQHRSMIYRNIADLGYLVKNSHTLGGDITLNDLKQENIIQSYRSSGAVGKDAKCMYWAPLTYQPDICLNDPDLSSKDTIVFKDGNFYKVSNIVTPNLQSAAFFHFQEWKRTYLSSTDFSPILSNSNEINDGNHWALTQYGAIPLLSSQTKSDPNQFSSSHDPGDEIRDQTYCLETSVKKNKLVCSWWTSWDDVHILYESSIKNKQNANNQVTLAMTLQISAEQVTNIDVFESLLNLAEINMNLWSPQPCILLLHIAGATVEWTKTFSQRWKEKEYGEKGQYILIGAIYSSDSAMVSRKALMNMVSDAAFRTRWVVTGLELERGLMLSKESVFFCVRSAMVYGSISSGDIFIIPQLAFLERNGSDEDDEESTFDTISITDLLKNDDDVSDWTFDLSPHDCQICDEQMEEKHEQVENQLDQLWWDTTRAELLSERTNHEMDDHTADLLSQVLFGIRRELSNLLLEERLKQFDKSPIIMMDRLGPKAGLYTKTENLARHVEELAGWQCHNALQLSQLASYGYRIRTVTGAFAISTPQIRQSICRSHKNGSRTHGSSRCDGCFMVEDSKLLLSLYHIQKKKPARAALLWHLQSEQIQ